MRLLSLDFDPIYGDDSSATRSTFSSDVSVFDYDVVIWDPKSSLTGYISYQTYMGLPRLSDDLSVRLKADIQRRHKEFEGFLNSGRTLIVLARPEVAAYCSTGEKQYSGTGRNRAATTIVGKAILQTAIPISGIEFTPARGDRIAPLGDGSLQALLRKYRDLFEYHAVIDSPGGKSLAVISGTDRAVGSIFTTESKGTLLLLPHIDLRKHEDEEGDEDGDEDEEGDNDDDDSDEYLDIAPEFQQDLIAAVEGLAGTKTTSRPSWSRRFATTKQLALRAVVVRQQKSVERARDRLTTAKQAAEESEAQDQLFLGSGRALELEVRTALEVIGGEVHEPDPGRDDWRVTFPEGKAVVEVKGVSKSAAEKHAAQLEKWVSASYEETGILHKGILVVNTWRDTPLDLRTQVDFPEQMIGYSTSRNHTLVTGLQLFIIRQQIEVGEATAEEWRTRLMGTNGQISGCEDWAKYLAEDVTGESSTRGL